MSATFAAINPSQGLNYGGFFGSGQAWTEYTIPAKVSAYPNEVWSDWCAVRPVARSDGGVNAVLHVSITHSSGTNIGTVYNEYAADNVFEAIAAPHLKQVTYNQIGDFTTTGTFAGARTVQSPIVAVEFVGESSGRIYSVAHYTDSIGAGQGTTSPSRGIVMDACALINAAGTYSVTPSMMCQPGDAPELTMRRMELNMGADRTAQPDIVVFRPYSTNTAGATWRCVPYMAAAAQLCKQYGLMLVLETGIYESLTPARNDTMIEVNRIVRAYAAANNLVCIEQEDLISSSNSASMLADGVHPSNSGHALMVGRHASAYLDALARIT